MRVRIRPILITSLALACGPCDDSSGSAQFFAPSEFGEYEFDPQPDIAGPATIDFGEVAEGDVATEIFEIRNAGRLFLLVDRMEASPSAFRLPPADERGSSLRIGEGEGVPLEVSFASGGRPASGELKIYSNDPDEPVFTIRLIANRTEPCLGSFVAGQPTWEFHLGDGPQCWPREFETRGHREEFQLAEIPPAEDAGWRPDEDNHISFERRSSLCGFECSCGDGGDFTFFQSFLWLPEAGRVGRYQVDIRDVDDGARVTVFSARYGGGVTDSASYARIPGGSTSDLAEYLVPGQNRIVITHVDDCCSVSRIRDVFVTIDGEELERCRD